MHKGRLTTYNASIELIKSILCRPSAQKKKNKMYTRYIIKKTMPITSPRQTKYTEIRTKYT